MSMEAGAVLRYHSATHVASLFRPKAMISLHRTLPRCLLAAVFAMATPGFARAADEAPAKEAPKAAPEKKAEPETVKFLGLDITPQSGLYVATKDAIVRAKPGSSAAKVDAFDAGTQFHVKGAYKGWLAVADEEGKDLGYVFAAIAMPLYDGTLADDIRSKGTTADGIKCDYNVHFEGKSPVQDAPFDTADYEVWFRCYLSPGRKVTFPTNMFMTEGPYEMGHTGPYQITLDVRQVAGDEYEQTLSTTLLYDRDKGTVSFDGVTLDTLAQEPKVKTRKAATLPAVLGAAVEIVLQTWNRKTLETVAKNL